MGREVKEEYARGMQEIQSQLTRTQEELSVVKTKSQELGNLLKTNDLIQEKSKAELQLKQQEIQKLIVEYKKEQDDRCFLQKKNEVLEQHLRQNEQILLEKLEEKKKIIKGLSPYRQMFEAGNTKYENAQSNWKLQEKKYKEIINEKEKDFYEKMIEKKEKEEKLLSAQVHEKDIRMRAYFKKYQ